MLSKWLTAETINIVKAIDNWQTAIDICAIPLLQNGSISSDYLQAIYHLHENIGPYYVLAPGIAMPHARPEDGVNRLGLSLLLVKQGVNFNASNNDPVYIIILLAAPDSESHLEIIQNLADLFSNSDDIQKMINANSYEAILKVIARY
ncbi:MAG: PTS sugar transporter subunit IIA [Candidatus Schmidhempelia sp.]|nr:PTS sugar transporter subunit IIA [Candidatus Schmidhempelia sp.]